MEYRAKGVLQDMPYVQAGLHCYFVHQGKWVDLHASVLEPADDDTKLLRELAAHLAYPSRPSSFPQIPKKTS